uniref:far upstream element-binding protein 1-like isoform X2 n=1 Tax=Erigeron canadensis TaxID=72917 RepID=UPI001CB8D67D|nr:far upstream element-binding protein 1-like isoform X2 [Erigeron canadensis]
MADEEVLGSASPAPSDHKRKLDDLDSEPLEQPPVTADSNGDSEPVADGDGEEDGDDDPDAKRPRFDDDTDGLEVGENGYQKKEEEPKEDLAEPLPLIKNTDLEEDQEQANEPLDSIELQSAENPEGSAKEDHNQESGLEQATSTDKPKSADGHTSDVAPQDDASGFKEQPTSTGQPTSRRMEVPSNKVGVLIGKAGDTIRTLQQSSGARIQITRDADADPNSASRSVELIGSTENINKAERLIKEVIAEADAGGSPSLVARGFSVHSSAIGEQVHIQVPNDKVGVIIGKGGETIKNLQARSGARIQLIPQHLPEGDQSMERTVRVTGERQQIEAAKVMIKEVMEQPIRSTPSGGNIQQNFRPRGSGPQWGPRGGHSPQPTGYNNYPPRGPAYPSQNPLYSSQGYGNYPSQQPPPKNNYGWDQRPPTNMQGPPEQPGYDYYGGPGGHMAASSGHPPIHSHAPGPAGPPPSQANYNYGQPQGPDYGQPPAPYAQTAPQGYGHGYGEARYDNQGPGQHPYGGQGTQPSTFPHGATAQTGYGQPEQYGKPGYNMPPQGSYGQPSRQQLYPASSGPVQPVYPQYGTAPAPAANDGYNNSAATPAGYGQQAGPPVSGYGQTGGQQVAPGYAQAGPTPGYGQYPSTQPGYAEQTAPTSAGYGYQGAPDPAYGGGPGMGYGAPPPVQPAYSQPAPIPAPVQPGYDQSGPQAGGYAAQPHPQPQAGYGQYDSSQMYTAQR